MAEITRADGVPDSLQGFEDFSTEWNVQYWPENLLRQLCRNKYYAKLAKGQKVNIPIAPTPTWKSGEIGGTLTHERSNPTYAPIYIDKLGYFSVAVDETEAELSPLDLIPKYQENGVKEAERAVQYDFFNDAVVYDGSDSSNKGSTAGAKSGLWDLGTGNAAVGVNSSNVVEVSERIITVLSEQNAILGGQKVKIVIPPWYRHLLMNSSLKNAMNMGDQRSILRTGKIGEIDGGEFYPSTELKGTGKDSSHPTYVIAMTLDAVAFTSRINMVRTFKTEHMQTLVQGKRLDGWGVVQSKALATLVCYKAAEV